MGLTCGGGVRCTGCVVDFPAWAVGGGQVHRECVGTYLLGLGVRCTVSTVCVMCGFPRGEAEMRYLVIRP